MSGESDSTPVCSQRESCALLGYRCLTASFMCFNIISYKPLSLAVNKSSIVRCELHALHMPIILANQLVWFSTTRKLYNSSWRGWRICCLSLGISCLIRESSCLKPLGTRHWQLTITSSIPSSSSRRTSTTTTSGETRWWFSLNHEMRHVGV